VLKAAVLLYVALLLQEQ